MGGGRQTEEEANVVVKESFLCLVEVEVESNQIEGRSLNNLKRFSKFRRMDLFAMSSKSLLFWRCDYLNMSLKYIINFNSMNWLHPTYISAF